MKWIKQNFKNIFLSLLSILVTLIVLDALLHLTTFKSLIKRDVYPRYYFQADDELGFVIAPNQEQKEHVFFDSKMEVMSNSLGCFDREYEGDEPFVYLTGDSFAWGFAPLDKKWGKQAESILGTRFLTCGTGGYGTTQELLKAKRDLKDLPAPSTIVVGYLGGNDVEDDANFPNNSVYEGYWVTNLEKTGLSKEEAEAKYENFLSYCTAEPSNKLVQGFRCWLNNHSIIYNVLKNNARPLVVALLPDSLLKKAGIIVEPVPVLRMPEDPSIYERHVDAVRGFKALAEEKGSKLLFVLIPSKDDVRNSKVHGDWVMGMNNERLKPYLDKEGVAYLDLLPEFSAREKLPETSFYWTVDGHWNVNGDRLAGLLVSKYMIEAGHASSTTSVAYIEALIEREFPKAR